MQSGIESKIISRIMSVCTPTASKRISRMSCNGLSEDASLVAADLSRRTAASEACAAPSLVPPSLLVTLPHFDYICMRAIAGTAGSCCNRRIGSTLSHASLQSEESSNGAPEHGKELVQATQEL